MGASHQPGLRTEGLGTVETMDFANGRQHQGNDPAFESPEFLIVYRSTGSF